MGNNTLYPNIPKAQKEEIVGGQPTIKALSKKENVVTITRVISADEFIEDIKTLENLAKEYFQSIGINNPNDKKINEFVMSFLRRNSYSGDSWNQVAGKTGSGTEFDGFRKFIETNDQNFYVKYSDYYAKDGKFSATKKEGYTSYRQKISIQDKNDELIDMRHMIVVLQANEKKGFGPAEKSLDIAAGWGGDLISQMARDKVYQDQFGILKYKQAFDEDELRADIDGYNISQNWNYTKSSLAGALESYYSNNTNGYQKRYTEFINQMTNNKPDKFEKNIVDNFKPGMISANFYGSIAQEQITNHCKDTGKNPEDYLLTIDDHTNYGQQFAKDILNRASKE